MVKIMPFRPDSTASIILLPPFMPLGGIFDSFLLCIKPSDRADYGGSSLEEKKLQREYKERAAMCILWALAPRVDQGKFCVVMSIIGLFFHRIFCVSCLLPP